MYTLARLRAVDQDLELRTLDHAFGNTFGSKADIDREIRAGTDFVIDSSRVNTEIS